MSIKYAELLFTYNLVPVPAAVEWPVGFECVAVRSPKDRGFAPLNRFCTESGFPPQWVSKMLAGGQVAWVVLTDEVRSDGTTQNVAVASAWATRNDFYVEELYRIFCPGPRGVYLFGAQVDERYRGRHFHTRLLRERLRSAACDGARWAYIITRDNNAVSTTNAMRVGFQRSAQLKVTLKGPLRIDRWGRHKCTLPTGAFIPDSVWLPFGYRVRRRAAS